LCIGESGIVGAQSDEQLEVSGGLRAGTSRDRDKAVGRKVVLVALDSSGICTTMWLRVPSHARCDVVVAGGVEHGLYVKVSCAVDGVRRIDCILPREHETQDAIAGRRVWRYIECEPGADVAGRDNSFRCGAKCSLRLFRAYGNHRVWGDISAIDGGGAAGSSRSLEDGGCSREGEESREKDLVSHCLSSFLRERKNVGREER